MELKDYYAIMGVKPTDDLKTIKTAYRRLARKYHPDVSKETDAEARFKEVAEAWEVLSDEQRRAEYDQLWQHRNDPQFSRQFQQGENQSYSAEDFLNLMSNQEFLAQLVQQYPILTDSYNNPNVRYVLEGYLFPATYDVAQGETLESLVTQMVDKTNEVLSKYQADIDASSYSLQDIMSIASLVEKEGQTTEDRKLIAGVFYNRLEQGMPIQSDISVLYALGTHKEMVTYDDLEVDSPYNLYTNAGLPPGPMNSPSEDAIAAALEPTDNDYLYFYANLKTGEVFYTDDYEQHQAWAQEYEETGDIQG